MKKDVSLLALYCAAAIVAVLSLGFVIYAAVVFTKYFMTGAFLPAAFIPFAIIVAVCSLIIAVWGIVFKIKRSR